MLLRAGRCRRVVVVGTEPDDPDAVRLYATRTGAPAGAALRAGAACLIVTTVGAGDRPLAELELPRDPTAGRDDGSDVDDLARIGDTYGAAGVVHTALAVARLGDGHASGRARVVCGDATDGFRHLYVTPATPVGAPDGVR